MQYRSFPKIPGARVSALGFGAMRLPVLGGDQAAIDQAALEGMVSAAAELGVNYIDTAYIYHRGKSEAAVGQALEALGLRDRFHVATKSPLWNVESEADWDRLLGEQLQRLRTDHIDFYLFHGLNAAFWDKVIRFRGIQAMERAKADGRISHLGFSFHDSIDLFKRIVDHYPDWEFCQVQYNYLDADYQAGRRGIEYAAAKELGAIVMEPLRGGGLAELPTEPKSAFGRWPVPRTPAEWAIRFALDPPGVTLALSGMGSADQLAENAAFAASALPSSLGEAEKALYDEAAGFFRSLMPVPCTTCGYCQPCPAGVSIPDVFALYNTASAFPARIQDRRQWYEAGYRSKGRGGNACVSCGECLKRCPQGIAIPDRLGEADALLAGR